VASVAADVARPDRDPSRRRGRVPVGLCAASLIVAAVFATPLAYLVWRNLTDGTNALDIYLSRRTLDPLRNTLVLAVAVAATSAVVGTALAWLTTRTDVPLRRVWAALAPLPLVFPSFVGAFALVYSTAPGGLADELLADVGLGSPGRIEGFWGAWLVLTLFTYPYVLLPVAARLGALPSSLEESARLLGRRPWTVFRTVVVPQISSAIGAGALLVFLYTVSDFGAVQILRYDTLTRSIYANRLLDRTSSLALSLLLAVVALAVTVAERELARRRPAPDAPVQRSHAGLRVALGRWRWVAFAGVVLFMAVALVGPLASLAAWAVRGERGIGVSSGDLWQPMVNTAVAGVVTAVVAVVVVLPIAYLVVRHRSRVGDAASALVVAGFALPGLVIALALTRITVSYPALYQSFTILVLAYVVHFGAQSMRTSQVAVTQVPHRLDDAARILGAGRARRFFTIDVPLMLPVLAAGAGLVLLSTMKELPVTLLLAPLEFETLATRIWGAIEDGFLAEAGATSLLLVAVSGVLTWFLVIRRAERIG
jgi:iron(III) transport system permease protein